MARIRSIKVDLFVDDSLADISVESHLLLAGLPCLADSAGRLEDRPKRIHAQLMPYRPAFDVAARLTELHDTGAITRYESGGVAYIQIANWERDQRPHVKEAASIIPAPAARYTEPRLGSGLAGETPGTRPSEHAGIMDSGCGVLDSGSGSSPPASQAAPEQHPLLPTEAPGPAKKAKKAKKPREPSVDPRHAPLSLALVGLGWPHHGGRTAKALKSLLALADQVPATAGDKAHAEVLRRAAAAKASTKFPLVRELHELADRWGHFAAPAEPPRPSILPRADDPEWETV